MKIKCFSAAILPHGDSRLFDQQGDEITKIVSRGARPPDIFPCVPLLYVPQIGKPGARGWSVDVTPISLMFQLGYLLPLILVAV